MKETNRPLYLSAPKKQKLERITRYLGDPSGRTCIDIGGDNGLISLLLREKGGEWFSADLEEETVESIRELVGENVLRTDGGHLPFPDNFFDTAVIVDFLEHIEDDSGLITELGRVLKPRGVLIINVPRLRPGAALPKLREMAGYTDEKHGHVRPGYTLQGLKVLLGDKFKITDHSEYIGFFAELADSIANVIMLKSGGGKTGRKGNVMTKKRAESQKGGAGLFRAAAAVMEGISALDGFLPRRGGASLIIRTESLKDE